MQKIPLTVRGAELLKQELQHLKSVARPEIIEAIAEARSHGDLSENAEYEAAKERQGFIEGRIAELEHKLSMAHIINPCRRQNRIRHNSNTGRFGNRRTSNLPNCRRRRSRH